MHVIPIPGMETTTRLLASTNTNSTMNTVALVTKLSFSLSIPAPTTPIPKLHVITIHGTETTTQPPELILSITLMLQAALPLTLFISLSIPVLMSTSLLQPAIPILGIPTPTLQMASTFIIMTMLTDARPPKHSHSLSSHHHTLRTNNQPARISHGMA